MTGLAQDFSMLAKLDLEVRGQPLGKMPGLLMSDLFWIIAAALTLLLVLLLWAKYLRNVKPRKRRSGGQKVFRGPTSIEEEPQEEETEEEANEARRRYKFRYKRRGHRNRNPTLSETGGLPPTRSGGPPGSLTA